MSAPEHEETGGRRVEAAVYGAKAVEREPGGGARSPNRDEIVR